MRLSDNFTLDEFLVSQTAERRGINNQPGAVEIDNIKALVDNVMQPFRNYVKRPITITSGFRSLRLNQVIGGSKNSQHVRGQACDFRVVGMTALEACRALVASGIKFDQLIFEGTWVHVSYSSAGNRGQILTAHFNNGRTSYTTGLTT